MVGNAAVRERVGLGELPAWWCVFEQEPAGSGRDRVVHLLVGVEGEQYEHIYDTNQSVLCLLTANDR